MNSSIINMTGRSPAVLCFGLQLIYYLVLQYYVILRYYVMNTYIQYVTMKSIMLLYVII